MTRGTFANIRIVNKFMSKPGSMTIHIPSGQELPIFDAAQLYKQENTPLIILTGKDYGCGSSRDWAAKGPYLLGVRAIIAESYERIHRRFVHLLFFVSLLTLFSLSSTAISLAWVLCRCNSAKDRVPNRLDSLVEKALPLTFHRSCRQVRRHWFM